MLLVVKNILVSTCGYLGNGKMSPIRQLRRPLDSLEDSIASFRLRFAIEEEYEKPLQAQDQILVELLNIDWLDPNLHA